MEAATLLTLRIPAFEAAIRKAIEPRLTTRPVVVVTSFKPLGRVLAACPDASSAGISEEMQYPAARGICPDAAFFVPDRQLAEQALRAVWKRAHAYSPQVEAAGGGYILLDTRGTEKLWGDGLRVAEKAQRDIHEHLRLPLAAGLAARRPWSLLASRAVGDHGIQQVSPGSERDFLDRVPVAWIDGITARTRTRLMEMNIHMAGQLRQFSREHIVRQFGFACGDVLWGVLHPQAWPIGLAGRDSIDVTDDAIRVEAFLPEASAELGKARLAVRTLAGQAAVVLRDRNVGAARLRLTLLHADGIMKNAFTSTGGFIQDEAVLTDIAWGLLNRIFQRRVRISRFWLAAERLAFPERQGILFSVAANQKIMKPALPSDIRKTNDLLQTLDRIRSRYGDVLIKPASLLDRTGSPRPQERRRVS